MAFINPIAICPLAGVRDQEPNNINDQHFANLMSLDGIKKTRSDEIKNKTTNRRRA